MCNPRLGDGIFERWSYILQIAIEKVRKRVMFFFAGDRCGGRAEGEQVAPRGLRDHRAVPVGAAAPIPTGSHASYNNIIA